MSVVCAPEIPGCTQLRFTVDAFDGIALSRFGLVFSFRSLWRFQPIVPGGTIGVFGASDDFGPFGGPTTIGGGGLTLDIDFAASGSPFMLGGGSRGFLDVAVQNLAGAATPIDLSAQFAALDDVSGTTTTGPVFLTPISPVPEPQTMTLVASGLALMYAMKQRRRTRHR